MKAGFDIVTALSRYSSALVVDTLWKCIAGHV